MSARREPSTPPGIPGYEYTRILGMGGFADVFLFEQLLPRRSVAVKVLLASSLSDEVRARFRIEADHMARLSRHPSIVTLYHADVAPDGRPYLVMEYCGRGGLGQRYRAERMGVPEVLRIGVRLACAVETAHRAGILHRDIKPANVLVTDFGWPALTDFGIAATTGWSSAAAIGMSIPWSPPELLAEKPAGGVRSDVYSLAATVYSLLAGRSPFEVADGRNGAADLIRRIEGAPLAPTGRGDVPAGLEAVLGRALDREPARRYHSALALARALQQVEVDLLLPPTPLDLPADADPDAADVPGAGVAGGPQSPPGAEPEPSEQATRLRPIPCVAPDAPRPAARPGAPAAASRPGPPRSEPPRPGGRGRVAVGVVAGLVVAGALAGVLLTALDRIGSGADADAGSSVQTAGSGASSAAPVLAVPSPTAVTGVLAGDGSAVFTWANPDPRTGDRYLWGVVVPGAETVMAVVDEPTVTAAPQVAGAQVCIEVAIVRADRRASTTSVVGCVG